MRRDEPALQRPELAARRARPLLELARGPTPRRRAGPCRRVRRVRRVWRIRGVPLRLRGALVLRLARRAGVRPRLCEPRLSKSPQIVGLAHAPQWSANPAPREADPRTGRSRRLRRASSSAPARRRTWRWTPTVRAGCPVNVSPARRLRRITSTATYVGVGLDVIVYVPIDRRTRERGRRRRRRRFPWRWTWAGSVDGLGAGKRWHWQRQLREGMHPRRALAAARRRHP